MDFENWVVGVVCYWEREGGRRWWRNSGVGGERRVLEERAWWRKGLEDQGRSVAGERKAGLERRKRVVAIFVSFSFSFIVWRRFCGLFCV